MLLGKRSPSGGKLFTPSAVSPGPKVFPAKEWAAATQENAGGKPSFLSPKAKASCNEKTMINVFFTNFYHVAKQFKVIDDIMLNDAKAGNNENCWTKWFRIDKRENNLIFYIKRTMISSLLTNIFFKSK